MMPTLRLARLSLLLATACLALHPTAQAVTPPPDGGYPNENTAEGTNALLYLSTGANNTALGYIALQNNTVGDYNTATGANQPSWNLGPVNWPTTVTVGKVNGTTHSLLSIQNFMPGGEGNPGVGSSAKRP